jgi:hypothetical protein
MLLCWDKHTGFESVLPDVAGVKNPAAAALKLGKELLETCPDPPRIGGFSGENEGLARGNLVIGELV